MEQSIRDGVPIPEGPGKSTLTYPYFNIATYVEIMEEWLHHGNIKNLTCAKFHAFSIHVLSASSASFLLYWATKFSI